MFVGLLRYGFLSVINSVTKMADLRQANFSAQFPPL